MIISFTGHRPNKLGGYDWNTLKNQLIMLRLLRTIDDVIYNSEDTDFHFIVGGALGIDQMAFHICYALKNLRSDKFNITIEVAVPFKDQPNAWFNSKDKDRYFNQLDLADVITYVDELEHYCKDKSTIGKYSAYKLQVRNEYMVDNSDFIIAAWDEKESGGTYNCIKYAIKNNKEYRNIFNQGE